MVRFIMLTFCYQILVFLIVMAAFTKHPGKSNLSQHILLLPVPVYSHHYRRVMAEELEAVSSIAYASQEDWELNTSA